MPEPEESRHYTFGYRYIVCKQDTVPFGDVTGHLTYTLQSNGF